MKIEVIYRDVYGKQEMNEFFELANLKSEEKAESAPNTSCRQASFLVFSVIFSSGKEHDIKLLITQNKINVIGLLVIVFSFYGKLIKSKNLDLKKKILFNLLKKGRSPQCRPFEF